jgi:hypothetical protein
MNGQIIRFSASSLHEKRHKPFVKVVLNMAFESRSYWMVRICHSKECLIGAFLNYNNCWVPLV